MSKRKLVIIVRAVPVSPAGLGRRPCLISDMPDEWSRLVDIDERALGIAKGLVQRMVDLKQAL